MRKILMFLLMIGLIAGLFISCIPTTPSGSDGEAVIEYTESITNQEGIGTFTVSDGQLSVEVLDADAEETIENIECFLSTDGTDAVILLVDPIGEYVPRLISCQNEFSNKGQLWYGIKQFYMDLKIKFIEGGSHLVYLDEYLPEGLTREILDQQYEHTKTTELKNLGGIFRGSINAWIDLGIGFVETQVVSLILTSISGVGGALYQIESDVRTIDEAIESGMISIIADTYENLGYEPDQKFEVWEAKWPSADFGLFLVLPCAPPKSSIPPTAYIDSIVPNPAQQGETVTFNGHGTDPDGEIMLYKWESNIDGLLSNLESFSRSDLSVGTHTISLKVFDTGANPSEVVSESLNITPVTTNTYIIIASAGSHGSISPSGDVIVNHGSAKSFTITPDAGYNIADVLIDGSSIGAENSYTFNNVTEDHTISATFISEVPSLVQVGTAIPWTLHSNSAIVHQINVFWNVYEGANGYKVYWKVNNGNWGLKYQGEGEVCGENDEKRQIKDLDVQLGNTYEYYVVAYGDDWETQPNFGTGPLSQFLPPIYLNSPSDQSTVSNSNITFQWTPLGGIPVGFNGPVMTELQLYDGNTNEMIWQIWLEDVTTSSMTFNQDAQAITSLMPGHTYGWRVRNYAFDQNMEDVITQSEYWEFTYTEDE